MFVGRETELRYLKHFYEMDGSKILVIYGSKGIGKTTLMRHFSKDYDTSFYVARSVSAMEQKYIWQREISIGSPEEGDPTYKEIFSRLVKPYAETKQILIIDEFQYIIKSDPNFMDELLAFVAEYSKTNSILVLLSSSYVGWVENDMVKELGKKATSIAGLLKVKDFSLADARKLFSAISFQDLVAYYSIFGGNLSLWQSVDFSLPVKENILQNIIPVASRLHDKMRMQLLENLRETGVYNTILVCLANGKTKLNDIYLHTGFSRAKISVYIKNLMTLGYVEKIFSFDQGNQREAKKGIYRISDPFLLFYYRFMFCNVSHLYLVSSEKFFERYILPDLREFMREGYIRICKEFLTGKMVHVAEWFGKSGNMDIVCRDAKNHYYVAKCVWNRKATLDDFEELQNLSKIAKLKPSQFILFSEFGFEIEHLEEQKDLILLSLSKEQ